MESNGTTEIDRHFHIEKPDQTKVENLIKAYLPETKKNVIPEIISFVVGFDNLDNRSDVENKICLLWKEKENE